MTPEPLSLCTGNPNKLREFMRLGLQDLQLLNKTLKEPETADGIAVVRSKATQAGQNVIVEDTSFDVDGENVGTNVKWLLSDLPKYEGKKATFRVLIGLWRGALIEVYEGVVQGTIVSPRGTGFGFDAVFLPDGAEKTLGEDKPDSLNARAKAVAAFLRGDCYGKFPILYWDGPWQP